MSNVHASKARRPNLLRAGAVVAVASLIAVLPATAASAADNNESIDFSGYTLGEPNGQHGWSSHTSRAYDFEIVDAGGHALRLSNATNVPADYSQMSQLFAPRLVAKAGESVTGAANDVFEMSFTVESTTGGFQEGLNISVAASGERSDGGAPQNRAGGLVNLTHLDGELAIWTTWPAEGTDLADWRNTGTRVPADSAHTIRYVVQFVEGDNNDVASLWVDGALVSDQLSSWENYHDAAEALAKQAVQGPLFRISGSIPTADGIGYGSAGTLADDVVTALEGEGLRIRDLAYSSYQSSPVTPPPATTEPPAATVGTAGDAVADSDSVGFEATGFDPLENVAITVYSTPYFAGWYRADVNGRIAGTISLPASITGGTHTLAMVGSSGNVALAPFSLARLAASGVDAAVMLPMAGIAGVLLLLGAGLLVGKQRRSRIES